MNIRAMVLGPGFINRREMEQRIDAALGSARNEDRRHTAVYFDLDQFRHVNHAFGHNVGDRYLQEISALLRSGSPETASLARVGGDEFTLLLPDTPVLEGWRIAESIADAVARHPFQHKDKPYHLKLTGGLAEVSRRADSFYAVPSVASEACRRAKRNRDYLAK